VLRLENIDLCHPQVRAVLTQGLASGVITDARGRHLYLSDTVVLLTAGLPVPSARTIGFRREDDPDAPRPTLDAAAAVGEELAAQVDLVCTTVLRSEATRRRWIEEHVLADLAQRYSKQGLHLHWDDTFVQWLLEHERSSNNRRDWERLMDETVSPLLIPHLAGAGVGKPRALIISWKNGSMQVETQTTQRGDM
jgi:ATP-dependent Clp protease ATP-binding subunit ClpC